MRLQPEPLRIERINWLKIVIPILALAVFVAVLLVGLDYTGKSSFCGNCHSMKVYAETWGKKSHKGTACVDCHQDPGLIGALSQRSEIIKNYGIISVYFQRQRPTLTTGVSTAGCLKCHGSITDKTTLTTGGVKVRHKEIVDAGLSCGRCHADIAHFSKAAKASKQVHVYCFACHKKMTAGGKCSFCHTRDIGDRGLSQIDDYRRVELQLNKCDGCHTTASCPSCHPEGKELEEF